MKEKLCILGKKGKLELPRVLNDKFYFANVMGSLTAVFSKIVNPVTPHLIIIFAFIVKAHTSEAAWPWREDWIDPLGAEGL